MTRATRARGEWRPAATLPVARVAVDVALAHLDRPFDYRVPAHLDEAAAPGVRVRVRFAGRLVDGFLLERVADTDHAGRLAWVDKVVSPEPVLTAEVAALCRAVADRYAGVLADVLRLAVPPRHARVEAEVPLVPGDARVADVPGENGTPAPGDGAATPARRPAGQDGAQAWARYPRGPALLDALAGRPGRARRLAGAAGRGVGRPAGRRRRRHRPRPGGARCSSCPTSATSTALHAALRRARSATEAVVALTADLGPAERYRRWLAVRRGAVRVVVGTRSAGVRPGRRPGLLAVWDDGDDLHAEPRAPYPHVRDVLVLRAHAVGAALLVGGLRPHRRGAAAGRVGVGQRDRRRPRDRPRRDAAGRRALARATSSSRATRGRAPPGCPPRRSRPPAPRWPRAGRCWSRRRGPATCRGCRARRAARPRAAATAPAR